MGDDVFDFLFDKHPIDKKKEFAIVVNITPQTSTEERKKQEKMADFKTTLNNAERVAIVKSDLKPVKDPEPVQHPDPVQEEPLDLRVVKRKEESPEKRAKSNQVCLYNPHNPHNSHNPYNPHNSHNPHNPHNSHNPYNPHKLLCYHLMVKSIITNCTFFTERRWTFEEKKKKITTMYKPSW